MNLQNLSDPLPGFLLQPRRQLRFHDAHTVIVNPISSQMTAEHAILAVHA